jgi:DNA-binding winged helix-turn-helix (wHTH) protein
MYVMASPQPSIAKASPIARSRRPSTRNVGTPTNLPISVSAAQRSHSLRSDGASETIIRPVRIARRIALARRPSSSNPVHLRFDLFELDEANARLLRDGRAVAVAPTPFSLLCVLARQPGALLVKDALLDAVWGHQFVTESVLKTAISDLRTVLGDNPRQPRFIETVPRRGYRFIAVPAATPAPTAVPAIEALTGTPQSSSFIGRVDAVARLRRAWSQANGGQRAIVWVAGEPGIGKTTLIEQFVAGIGGVAFARGQCVEHYGTGEPYLPMLEALAELCRKDPRCDDASHGGTDMAVATAVAEHRGGA